jgi:putative ABC transport system substrate-binding protein
MVSVSHAAEKTQAVHGPRLGYLVTHTDWIPYFVRAMSNLGYVEGKNFVVEWRKAGDKWNVLPRLAQELVDLRVDIILADSSPSTIAAKRATSEIPIVMVTLADPVGVGLVDSFQRPGGNVTGTTIMTRDVMAKRVQLLKEAIPMSAPVEF